MAKYFLLASLAFSAISCQDRYWGSYSAVYPAGGSGSSADVAFDVASLQEASRQSLVTVAPRAVVAAPRAVAAPTQQRSFGTSNQASRPGGYVHNPTGDTGHAYVHDTTGDHGPYYYWKLRQQAKSGQTTPAAPAPAPAPAPQRKVVTVRKQKPAPRPTLQQTFVNFAAIPTAQAAPARQQYQQPAPVRQQYQQPAPQPIQYGQARAPEYQNDFSLRAYAYTAPTYGVKAQGTSFSLQAQF